MWASNMIGGDIRWTLKRVNIKTLAHPSSMEEDATYVEKEVFKVEVY